MTILYSSLQLGLLYGIMVLGIYISFRILDIPDLTTEGSFAFGLAVSGILTDMGHPYLGLVFALLAGTLAGCVTGLLQTKMRIHPILAGIITMSGLYSINISVLREGTNISLIGDMTIFTKMREVLPQLDKEIVKLLIAVVFTVIFVVLLALFFKTHFGLCIRATGDNQEMLKASSVNVDITKIAALGISNACIAFSGGLIAQYQSFADISSGTGILVVGLSSVIIGEAIMGKHGVTLGLISAIVGSVIYRFIMALIIKYSIFPSHMLKLISAVIVAVTLSIPAIKMWIQKASIRRGGMKNAGN